MNEDTNKDDVIPTDEEGMPLDSKKAAKREAAETASESEDFVAEGETDKDTVKKLREALKQANAEKMQAMADLQRAKADFLNMRKRDEEDKKAFVKFAKEGLVEELLPVLESFDMARANKEAWEKADKNWRTGVEYIHTQLLKILSENGVEEIDPMGKEFDAARDEAVSYEAVTEEKDHHKVVKVIQKGYSLSGKQVRAPKVVVGEYKKG